MSRRVPLNNGYTALVSDKDYDGLMLYTWTIHKRPAQTYAVTRVCGELTYMHRFVLCPSDNEWVDHINGNGLDNTRENIRVCSPSQNSYNRTKQKNNTSGYKGVSRCRDRWRAQIQNNGRQVFLGVFSTPKDAASAYNKAASAIAGTFAQSNTNCNPTEVPK